MILNKWERISRHEMMMRMAWVTAMRGTCDRLRVGAIISRDGRAVATGYNGNVAGMAHCRHTSDAPCDTAVHAEANAIAMSAKHGVSTDGAVLYVTHETCYACARLIVNAGIKRVIFMKEYRRHDGTELLRSAGVEVFRLSEEDESLIQVTR